MAGEENLVATGFLIVAFVIVFVVGTNWLAELLERWAAGKRRDESD